MDEERPLLVVVEDDVASEDEDKQLGGELWR